MPVVVAGARVTHTHTYATMQISSEAYDEIRQKLIDVGYQHAINDEGELDMHGIALTTDACNCTHDAANHSDQDGKCYKCKCESYKRKGKNENV